MAVGLYEFEEMAFVIHVLRPGDVFIDIGANIGVYTVIAAGVASAKCISFEPVPETFSSLKNNVNINNLQHNVTTLNIGVGDKNRVVKFTSTLDTMNHVIDSGYIQNRQRTIDVPLVRLDDAISNERPKLIKIDVEGFESEVIAGATRTLRRRSVVALVLERHLLGDPENANEKLIIELEDLGFFPFCYLPFTRKLEPIQNNVAFSERNIIFIRDLSLVSLLVSEATPFSINGITI